MRLSKRVRITLKKALKFTLTEYIVAHFQGWRKWHLLCGWQRTWFSITTCSTYLFCNNTNLCRKNFVFYFIFTSWFPNTGFNANRVFISQKGSGGWLFVLCFPDRWACGKQSWHCFEVFDMLRIIYNLFISVYFKVGFGKWKCPCEHRTFFHLQTLLR